MKNRINWVTLALLISPVAKAGARVELDLTQTGTTVDVKAYGAPNEHLGYFARDIESYSSETGSSRFTVGTLSYDWNFGGGLVTGIMNTKPILGAQYKTKVLGTNCLLWIAASLEKEPSLNQLVTLERTGDKGLTTGLEGSVSFNKEGYILSKERLRLGYTSEEGIGLGLAGNFTQTQDTSLNELGIYLRLTR